MDRRSAVQGNATKVTSSPLSDSPAVLLLLEVEIRRS